MLKQSFRVVSCTPRQFSLRHLALSSRHGPSPPLLSREEQEEFDNLVRSTNANKQLPSEEDFALHPDARKPLTPEFEGDINPITGEQGGPKREPVGKWNEGDWSFKGRITDF